MLGPLRRAFPLRTPSAITFGGGRAAWARVEVIEVSPPSVRVGAIQVAVLSPPRVATVTKLSRPETRMFPLITEVAAVAELTWMLAPPAAMAVGPEMGVPEPLGKRYGTEEGAKAERERARQRHRDAIREASRLRRFDAAAIRKDLFELIKPILMPPLSSEQGEAILMPGELYDFQRYGVKWLTEEPARLLADDMGLGKTVQAITAFRALVRRGEATHALVVCPASLVENWRREFARWAPELNVYSMEGSESERQFTWPIVNRAYHVVLTTYDRLKNDVVLVSKLSNEHPIPVLILDEIQYVKNRDSERCRAIKRVHAERRWGLSGTPLENREEELQTVLEVLTGRSVPLAGLRQAVERHMLRRRKKDALVDLPDLVKNLKYLELGTEQRSAYGAAERDGILKLRDRPDASITHVLALITALKQICNGTDGRGCKVEFLTDYLEEVLAAGEKAILFSQYKEHFDALAAALGKFTPLTFTGELSPQQRTERLDRFASAGGGHSLLLMTLGAGGVGLNITAANHVIHYDSWWNPARAAQATGRAHRLGQRRTVVETTLVCAETIEERIQEILDRKRVLFDRTVDDFADKDLAKVMSEEELFGLFGLSRPARAGGAAGPSRTPGPSAASATGPMVVSPATPYSNLAHLRKILRSCSEYIKWADPHFNVRAFEELVHIEDGAISKIEIISGARENNVNPASVKDYRKFQVEMATRGVSVEWRITTERFHDRFIVSRDFQHNVPPVNTIFAGQYSEMLPTPHRPPFEQWFERGTEVTQWGSTTQ